MKLLWKRWSIDYLTTLQQRTEWLAEQATLQIGDTVFVKDDNTSPMMWPIAKVIEVFDANNQTALLKSGPEEDHTPPVGNHNSVR